MVRNENGEFAKKYQERLLLHVHVYTIQLLGKNELVRRLRGEGEEEEEEDTCGPV